jgi:hypothetical protein
VRRIGQMRKRPSEERMCIRTLLLSPVIRSASALNKREREVRTQFQASDFLASCQEPLPSARSLWAKLLAYSDDGQLT